MIFDENALRIMEQLSVDYKLLMILYELLKYRLLTFNLSDPIQKRAFNFLVTFIREQEESRAKGCKIARQGYHIIFGLIARELVASAYY